MITAAHIIYVPDKLENNITYTDQMECNIMTSSFFWASLKAVSASLVSMHLWSCVWYMIACDNLTDGGYCTADTWANTNNLDYGMLTVY